MIMKIIITVIVVPIVAIIIRTVVVKIVEIMKTIIIVIVTEKAIIINVDITIKRNNNNRNNNGNNNNDINKTNCLRDIYWITEEYSWYFLHFKRLQHETTNAEEQEKDFAAKIKWKTP